ncbi:MAG TPA: GDSL-type esterase/lipase family protein [Chryseosolibacter sp.]|nr:GDSL-type esterase/lipase family protein [Chryseosolibacter sp.]
MLFFFITAGLFAQDPLRFKKEVTDLKASDSLVVKKRLNLFTGSSSIRLWADLQQRFSEANVVNRGFGGSLMHELHYYTADLILDYRPRRVFIYEGDNDLGTGKHAEDILRDADKILSAIRCKLGRRVKVYFITPKPSIRRWDLKSRYENYIAALKNWARERKNVAVIDVWTPMLNGDGNVRAELFVDDGLHMNQQGYDIWAQLIRPHLLKK